MVFFSSLEKLGGAIIRGAAIDGDITILIEKQIFQYWFMISSSMNAFVQIHDFLGHNLHDSVGSHKIEVLSP